MKIFIVRYKKTAKVFEGGEQGSEKNLAVLQQIVGKDNVYTYFVHDESVQRKKIDYLKGLFFSLGGYYFGLTPRRVRKIVLMAQGYDVVFIDRSLFGIVAKQLKHSNYKGRVICFFHNVEAVYFSAKYSSLWNPLRWITVKLADYNDKLSCHYADKIIALSKRDDNELQGRYGRRADVLIPVVFVDRYKKESYPHNRIREKPLCMFLGAYFPANVEGIEWFVKNVYPKVNIQMQIVGKGMDKIRSAAWMRNNIGVISDAPDLEPYFEAADIMVLPIFKGSGMKVKTCESLMYGKNIIATDEALVGYDVDESRIGARCNTVDEFVLAINDFCKHPRPRFNEYSRQTFLEKYSMSAVIEKFRQAISE